MSLPTVPYHATAERPDWADLPTRLRAAVGERLRTPVIRAVTARGGFTTGFAGVLHLADGGRVFLKAASLVAAPDVADWYAREAAVTSALPSTVPAARPRWTLTAAEHFVVCLDAVDGRVPRLPWRGTELDAALAAWATAAAELRRPPDELLALRLPRLADLIRSDLSWWSRIADRREPEPLLCPSDRLAELVALERALPALVDAPGVTHGDLRIDNVLIDTAGRGWICDWTWPCHGAAWFDTATLLVSAHASGVDTDALFVTHPTATGAPPEALDSALAALAGYWLTRAPRADAWHAAHHRFSGAQALRWLGARRGWA